MISNISNSFKSFLDANRIVLINTDTVPGIITKLSDKDSIDEIYKIKGRSKKSPCAIFVSDLEMAKKFCEIDEKNLDLMNNCLPGYFTFILKIKNEILKTISKNVISYSDNIYKIGIRIPKSEAILEIIRDLDEPLVATSANISGEKTPKNIEEVDIRIRKKIAYFDLVSTNPKGLSSTIIDLTKTQPEIIRNGSGVLPSQK